MSSLALSTQPSQTLAFNGVNFDVIARASQPWLRVNQIGLALGYKNPDLSINKLYRSNADEFTESMTTLVEVDTQGGKQKTRIFSLRGCHLLAMFARTKVAKEFRKWVLDRLDEYLVENQPQLTIASSQQRRLHDIVGARVASFPKEKHHLIYKQLWNKHNKHFGIAKYNQLPAEKFEEAMAFLETAPLEGDYLPADVSSVMSPEQQAAVLALIKSKICHLEESDLLDLGLRIFDQVRIHFGSAYSELAANRFHEVLAYIAGLDELNKEAIVIDLDAKSAVSDVKMYGDMITLELIQDGYAGGNPVNKLFMMLQQAAESGKPVHVKNIVGAKALWMAVKELAWSTRHALLDIQRAADSARGRGIRLGQIVKS